MQNTQAAKHPTLTNNVEHFNIAGGQETLYTGKELPSSHQAQAKRNQAANPMTTSQHKHATSKAKTTEDPKQQAYTNKQHPANTNGETAPRTGTQQTQDIDWYTPGNPRQRAHSKAAPRKHPRIRWTAALAYTNNKIHLDNTDGENDTYNKPPWTDWEVPLQTHTRTHTDPTQRPTQIPYINSVRQSIGRYTSVDTHQATRGTAHSSRKHPTNTHTDTPNHSGQFHFDSTPQ